MKTAARAALLAIVVGLFAGVAIPDPQLRIGLDAEDRKRLKQVELAVRTARVGFSLANAMKIITPEDEYYIGRAVAARLLTTYSLWDDPETSRYLDRVGQSLVLASPSPEAFRGYRFFLLDSDEINAFACPGAVIFVTRGMLRLASSEDELAAVLAHEIAHAQSHHGRELIQEKRWKKFWSVAATSAVGSVGGSALSKLSLVLGSMAENLFVSLHTEGYGKKLEHQADAEAVEILDRAGYDPHALASVLVTMGEALDPKRKDFARTHQRPAERLKELKGELRRHPARAVPAVRRQRYQSALAAALAE